MLGPEKHYPEMKPSQDRIAQHAEKQAVQTGWFKGGGGMRITSGGHEHTRVQEVARHAPL